MKSSRATRLWLEHRLVVPLASFLQQGLQPRRLSLCLALGMAISIFPICGVTSLLCLAVAPLLRLNLPAMQLANLACTPLQLLFLLPQIRLGEKLFGSQPTLLSATEIAGLLQADLLTAVTRLWLSLLYGIAAWALLAPAVVILLYATLLPLIHRLSRRIAPHPVDR